MTLSSACAKVVVVCGVTVRGPASGRDEGLVHSPENCELEDGLERGGWQEMISSCPTCVSAPGRVRVAEGGGWISASRASTREVPSSDGMGMERGECCVGWNVAAATAPAAGRVPAAREPCGAGSSCVTVAQLWGLMCSSGSSCSTCLHIGD